MKRRPLGRWMPLLAVAALLVGGVLTSALSSPAVTRVPLPPPRPLQPEAPTAEAVQSAAPDQGAGAEAAGFQLPTWIGTVAAGLCVALVVVIVGMLVWYVFRDRIRVRSAPLVVEPAPARTDDVVAALDAGLDRLGHSDTDPRRAVIACWVRLEETAAAAGTPRHPGDTPTDLVARLLVAHRVSLPVLDEFAAVYREARYATHVVDERTRAAAARSLGQLRDELTVHEGVG
jgi:hypothetical protein